MEDVWFVELHRNPGNAEAVFGHRSRHTGRVLWGVTPWMAPVDPVTEFEVLNELYRAVLDLQEARSHLT